MWFFKSKKILLTLSAMVAVTLAFLLISDVDRLRWFTTILAGLVGSFNVGQGIADGWSNGKTSSSVKGQQQP